MDKLKTHSNDWEIHPTPGNQTGWAASALSKCSAAIGDFAERTRVVQIWKDIKHTLRNFLIAPQQMGTILPSSIFLARKMANCADLQSAACIVELGAGTGVITHEMIRRANAQCKILILDLNIEAIHLLRSRLKNHTNVEVIHADARDLEDLLSERGIKHVDAVFSSLPYATLGPDVTREILETVARVLNRNGHFIAFQYTSFLRKSFENFFTINSSQVEYRNLPPAIVYNCVSKRKPEDDSLEQKSA